MINRYLITVISILVLVSTGFAQRHERMKAMQKMEELKKIKLIEILQMDEETSIKFFTRRSEHMSKVENINQAIKDKMNQIEEMVTNIKDKNDPTLKRAVDEYLQLQEKVMRERQNFFKSVSELLSYEQMGKLVVFEEKFRSEISGLLFRQRMKKK